MASSQLKSHATPAKKTARSSKRVSTTTVAGSSKAITRATAHVFARSALVGKFPGIQHQSAPKAAHKLSDEKRKNLLAAMVLA